MNRKTEKKYQNYNDIYTLFYKLSQSVKIKINGDLSTYLDTTTRKT